MNNFKLLVSILLISFISNTILAQSSTVSGVVSDGSFPLPGASVVIEGTKTGVNTDFDGKFRLNKLASGEVTLKISFIGHVNKVITVFLNKEENKNLGTVILKESAQQLEEVVITALGIKKEEKSLGYSVSNLKAKELNEAKETNLVNALNGKIAGVQITNGSTGVGSTSRVVIRGESSLTLGGNGPLFVVDGVPIHNNTIFGSGENTGGSEMQEVDYGNGASEIDPDSVESISVLKGANAAALYGSRGSNGVILINTKTAKRNKGLSISINTGTTLEEALRLPKYQNKYGQGWSGEFEYADGLNNSLGKNDQEDVSWGPEANGQLITQFDSPAEGGLRAGDIFSRGWVRDANGKVISPTSIPNDVTATPFTARPNNVKNFYRTGHTTTFSTAIGFGSDKSDFLFSFGLLDNEGIIPNTGLKRRSYRVNGSIDVTDKLKISLKSNYINSNSTNRPSSGYGSESAMYMFTWYGRTVNTNALKEYWQRGYEGLEQYNYNYAWHDNPYFMLNENTNAFNKHRVLGNIKLEYQFSENLKFQAKSGIDYYTDRRESKRAYSTQRFLKGAYKDERADFKEVNTDFLFSYDKNLNDVWGVSANFGGNQMKQEINFLSNIANGLVIPELYNLQNSVSDLVTEQYKEEKEINSLYGTLGVSYDNKVFVDITVRNDWSSTLPEKNNSYFYPSASVSLLMNEIFEMPAAFSFFKIRGSLAKVGNDTSPYNLKTPYSYQTPYAGNKTLSRSTILLNENLKPEMSTSFEVGTDLRMFNGAVGVDFTYYKSSSENQIMTVPITNTVGYSAQVINAGKIENKGIEALLTLKPIRNENFAWISSINFSKNEGKVLELAENTDVLTMGYASVYGAETSKVFVQARKGERLGNMYGRKFERYNGKIIYKDGKPLVNDELQLLGNYNPDFSLGFKNSFKYKNFDFSFLVDWKQGGTIISRTKQIATYAGNLEGSENRNNYEDIVPDGVKQVGDEYVALTDADAVGWWTYYKPMYDRRNQQETGIVDATYVKLREVKFGYDVPTDFVQKLGMESLKISIVGRNLGLWTPSSNPHFDPETLAMQGSNIVPGIEDVSYPSSRSYGVNFLFKF
ncbi:SusC/RagA family TonB-linked outer membrane protein [Tenacibaculum ovolyticum]|uniref:SusC/RagA family TonB-linked outer membrane protein n=1 Tax=Tenacibaculum ovolyticum TaxID=104270 RepID=UPI001EEF4186|nr:SusC/RagA family TonB-linked outer membrane protein [Tenacibaculum ovolyticum]